MHEHRTVLASCIGVSPDILSFINSWSLMAFRDFISQAVISFDLLLSYLFPTPTELTTS